MSSRAVVQRCDKYWLRPLTFEDSELIVKFYQQRSFWMYLIEGALSEAQAKEFVRLKVALTDDSSGHETWWAVEDPKISVVIGTANLKILSAPDEKRGSVGCALAPQAQGQGLGPRIGWDLIALGFNCFALELIECSCAENNARSAHTMRDTFQMNYLGLREAPHDGRQDLWREHVFSISKDTYLATKNDVEARLITHKRVMKIDVTNPPQKPPNRFRMA